MRSMRLITGYLVVGMVSGCLVSTLRGSDGDEPRLQRFENSPGLSQLLAINNRGQAIGMKDVADEIGFVQRAFFIDGQQEAAIPMVPGYTNLQPLGLSDDGKVIGYVSRYSQEKRGDLRAFVWDTATGGMETLLPPDNLDISHACDITADGHVVVGYVTGADPPRMLPCVWQRTEGGWEASLLPTLYDFNPLLMSSGVVISDDGRRIAACITVDVVKSELGERYIHHLFQWDRGAGGSWQRRKLREHSARLGGINNLGTVVGSCMLKGSRRAFVVAGGDFQLLPLFDGDQSSEALDVNNHDVVVGFSDDPHGPVGGPQAFVWRVDRGKLTRLQFPPGLAVYSAAHTVAEDGRVGGYFVPSHADDEAQVEKTVGFVLTNGF